MQVLYGNHTTVYIVIVLNRFRKNFVIWALRAIYQRDENYRLPPYQFRCEFLNIQALWRRRINASIFFIYDLLLGKIVSRALREKIDYTRQQYDANQRNLRNSDLIRVLTFRSEYAHNQPFYVACRLFNKMRQQFFESASRQMFRRRIVEVDNSVFT